ncbi:MAG: Gfo/Idh/MocA family oxidoreductase [Brucellaceae bacterium]|nr:Gfo/Idh/MocA family oxidoreductase [Brucellaceae bacterium]
MSRRVAILGAGIGTKHLDGYLALGDRFAVTHVCDLNEGLAGEQAARAGAAVSASIADVLADPEVEIVDICLPPMMHVPVALDALAAGKHVICEKPIAGSLADADRLAAAARAAGRQVFPVFQYRYAPAFRVLGALKHAGLLGAPRAASLETHWNRGADYYAIAWRGTWAREMGGAVLSHAIHIHDLAARLLGPIEAVSAMLATSINPIETEDCAAISFRTASGALVTSSITLGAADDTSRLRLVFEHATVESGRVPYAPGEGDWHYMARDPARQGEIDAVVASASADKGDGFAGFLAAIADALDGKPEGAVSMEDGVKSIELVTAIYHADRTGARVSLPLDRGLPICNGWAP